MVKTFDLVCVIRHGFVINVSMWMYELICDRYVMILIIGEELEFFEHHREASQKKDLSGTTSDFACSFIIDVHSRQYPHG